jgi:ATP-dependent exoDNAse (exonuclease V) beta subunit
LFPHSRSATDRAELEEERRLAYVAMTRAERYLYVTHAMKRRVYGEELASEPSPFLNEMPIELLEDLSLGKSWLSFAMDRLRSITSTASTKRAEEVRGQDLRQR